MRLIYGDKNNDECDLTTSLGRVYTNAIITVLQAFAEAIKLQFERVPYPGE